MLRSRETGARGYSDTSEYDLQCKEDSARTGRPLPDRMPPSPPDTYRIGWRHRLRRERAARMERQCPSFVTGPKSPRRTKGGS